MTVGIRELRQNPTEAIRRARRGEVVTITDRGRPVVQMGPVPVTALERAVEAGIATRPSGRPLSPPLPLASPGQQTLTEVLFEMRQEERY